MPWISEGVKGPQQQKIGSGFRILGVAESISENTWNSNSHAAAWQERSPRMPGSEEAAQEFQKRRHVLAICWPRDPKPAYGTSSSKNFIIPLSLLSSTHTYHLKPGLANFRSRVKGEEAICILIPQSKKLPENCPSWKRKEI